MGRFRIGPGEVDATRRRAGPRRWSRRLRRPGRGANSAVRQSVAAVENAVDALLLSRVQFGFVISFHILFPAFTIGLANWLAFIEWRWLRPATTSGATCILLAEDLRGPSAWAWSAGIVMSNFQFGTNWAVLSEKAGNILGPLLSYEC